MSLKDDLLKNKTPIGVFGCGFIGYSTLAYFANEGIDCIGCDLNENVVANIKMGYVPVRGLEKWLPFNTPLIWATSKWEKLKECNPIFVAIPTEKGTEPWYDALEDVIAKLNTFEDEKLIIVESTLSPGTSEKIILPDFKHKLVVAPRRDWFVTPEKNLKSLPRIVGGIDEETTKEAVDVLSIVCDTLHPCDYRVAELVKATENAMRQVCIDLANQMVLAYPGIDIKKVLELVGTKWNVETYVPGLGVGGYCIPLASKYLIDGAEFPHELTILMSTLESEATHPDVITAKIMKKFKPKRVGILGLAYKGNIKVSVLSPTFTLTKLLKKMNISFKVYDPMYTPEEIRGFGYRYFEYLSEEPGVVSEQIKDFDMLILVSDHDVFRQKLPHYKEDGEKKIYSGVVVDNTNLWRKWKDSFKAYVQVGVPF